MIQISKICISVPGAYIYVRGFSLLGIFIYYLLLIGNLSGWFWTAKRRAKGIAICTLAAGFFSCEWYASHSSASLTILPYNGSLTVFCQAPGRAGTFLIDCGTSNTVQFITKPFLRAQGIDRLPALLLTHGDLHHIGGSELIAELFQIKQVCASPVRFRSPVYRRALEQFHRSPGRVRIVECDQRLGPWTVLYPPHADHFQKADDNAVVLRGIFNGTSVLLCSDLGSAGQNALLERARELRSDIVVTGLPSGSEPLADSFLEAIQPRLIIVADSEFPVTERASIKLQERLANRRVQVIYTRSAGAVTIEFGAKQCKVRTMNGGARSGRSN